MARPEITPIIKTEGVGVLGERTRESHPSFALVGVSYISSSPPGVHLFESELQHQRFIRLSIMTAERERDLHRSWLHGRKTIIEVDMSLAQWGAIVSSPNHGQGQPATLSRYHKLDDLPEGMTPQPPFEPQLARSHEEVREAGAHALEKIREAQQAVQDAFDNNLSKKVLRERLHTLQCMVDNGPGNMEFAAKSFTKHVEEVVTKARGDLETMVQQAALQSQHLQIEDGSALADRLLGPGEGETHE